MALASAAYTARAQTQTSAPDLHAALGAASGLPANVNPFRAANKRDKLDGALIRLAEAAMTANLDEYEPWLFDRATTYYKLALWTGERRFEEHAFALVNRYYSLIDENGQFTLKPGDGKYAYVDGAVWYEHATGDRKFRPQAEAVYRMWLGEFPARYSAAQGFWTEREIAYALGAAVGWYELSGDQQALGRAKELVEQWADMSMGTGAPLHTLQQHQEEFEPPWAAKRMTSPWMAGLFLEYLQHYERLTGDPLALRIVSDYADFLLGNCLYDGKKNHPNLSGKLMAYYLCGENQTFYDRETPSEADGEHSPDLMAIMASAVYAKRKLGLDPKAALDAYRRFRESAEFFVSRRADVQPPRKINWWIGTSYDSTALVE
jgi:hypothetical protein